MTRKCPKCESTNISKDKTPSGSNDTDLICGDCGYDNLPQYFDVRNQKDSKQKLLNFIDSTEMDEDVKKAMYELLNGFGTPDVKPVTMLRRANQCLSEHEDLLRKLPHEIHYIFISEYINDYNNRERVLKDYEYIENEKDLFYLIKTYSGGYELIIYNGKSLEPLSEQDRTTGFLWGYRGSGTNTTARVILKKCFPNIPYILDLAIDFSLDMLNANKLANDKNGIVRKQDVLDWFKNFNIVKRACKELGITQKELAEKLGITPSAISQWGSDVPKTTQVALELMIENNQLKKDIKVILEGHAVLNRLAVKNLDI